MTKGSKDWAYDYLGMIAYTMELWDLDVRAGAHSYREIGGWDEKLVRQNCPPRFLPQEPRPKRTRRVIDVQEDGALRHYGL